MTRMLDGVITTVRSWDAWTWFGLTAQLFFGGRFLVQWVASERAKRVVIPALFWWLSLLGGTMILVYAIVIGNIVFTVGSSLALLIYVRNTWLHYRARRSVITTSATDRMPTP